MMRRFTGRRSTQREDAMTKAAERGVHRERVFEMGPCASMAITTGTRLRASAVKANHPLSDSLRNCVIRGRF